jgi:hypothetical protein
MILMTRALLDVDDEFPAVLYPRIPRLMYVSTIARISLTMWTGNAHTIDSEGRQSNKAMGQAYSQ